MNAHAVPAVARTVLRLMCFDSETLLTEGCEEGEGLECCHYILYDFCVFA